MQISQKQQTYTYRNANKKPKDKAKWVEMELTDQEDLQLFTLGERASNQITVKVLASGKEMSMELDTGAAVSTRSSLKTLRSPYSQIFPCNTHELLSVPTLVKG